MKNLATGDFGTYYPLIVPGPDETITLAWGSAIARNTARVTRGMRFQGTVTSTLAGDDGLNYTAYQSSAFPMLFYWKRIDGSFSNEDHLGSGCTYIAAPSGGTESPAAYFATVTNSTARLRTSKSMVAYTYHLFAFGR